MNKIGILGDKVLIGEVTNSLPLEISVPPTGVFFAESVHAKDFEMPERADPFHKLVFVQRGRVELQMQQGDRVIETLGSERALLPIRAGVRHRILDQEPSVIFLLGMGDGFLRRDPDVWEIWQRLLLNSGNSRVMDEGFAGWWRRAVLEQTLQGSGYSVTVKAMAWQVLVAVDRHVTRPRADSTEERVRAVRRAVRETFFESWDIDRAAQRAGLSRRQFTLRFRDLTGQTFVAFLNGLRLEHAERLLQSGGHSVTGATFSAGFEDLSHFYRLFRGKHGMPPRRWLEQQGLNGG